MSTTSREHYSQGIDKMVENHPTHLTQQGRYNAAVAAMETVGFTPDELRGMLSVALDRLAAK